MERIISQEDRLKRAEEIYYRRKQNNSDVRVSSSQVREDKQKRQFSLYKKMAVQILVCILIYLVFSLIKEANYLFSEDVINKTKEFLSTDISFEAVSTQTGEFFKNNQDKFSFITNLFNPKENEENQNNETANNEITNNENANSENVNSENTNNEIINSENANSENVNNENVNSQNQENTNQTNEQNNNQSQNNTQAQTNNETSNTQSSNNETGIGGGNTESAQNSEETTSSKKTQMEKDAEYIKENFELTLPAKAGITSRYGRREPTEIISENHQGIDIGVVVGTKVVSAMKGKVSVVSNEGDYGTHVKIVNEDVTTIYAHCSKILVKEGETVEKGQEIALSGNTGKTTGPHLHFEIRRDNRTVNPELVLSWN